MHHTTSSENSTFVNKSDNFYRDSNFVFLDWVLTDVRKFTLLRQNYFGLCKLLLAFAVNQFLPLSDHADAAIHRAPVVLPGFKIRSATRYPISTYRVFRSDSTGKAVPIPFQIDEINEWGDYVLDLGGDITKNTGNGIFDLQDELVLMGDDVGPAIVPTTWPSGTQPSIIYELRFRMMKSADGTMPNFEMQSQVHPSNSTASTQQTPASSSQDGAVYVAVFFRKPPPPSTQTYVQFNVAKGEVVSSRYRYEFDKKNYLVVNGVDMLKKNSEGSAPTSSASADPLSIPLLNSSTFFMKADLKYFVTVLANHRSVDSKIEAYKIGPVRSVVRVSFFYSFLKLKFELGMYTEVSFFSNSVVLPAIMYNPLDGPKSLNRGSGFYYGFSVKEHIDSYQMQTNMARYQPSSVLGMLRTNPKPEPLYWMSMTKPDRMLYLEIMPSQDMLKASNFPSLYVEQVDGDSIKSRPNDQPLELGKSPVNVALFFDLTRFTKGEHRLSIRLFFENYFSQPILDSFKDLPFWETQVRRL